MRKKNKNFNNFLGFLFSSSLFILAAVLYPDFMIKFVFFGVGLMNLGISISYLRKYIVKMKD